MNTSIIRSAGLAAGILVGLFIAFVIIRFANSNKKYKTDGRSKFAGMLTDLLSIL